MTNPILPDHSAELPAELSALAPVGGRRRPVRVVEHPAFRVARLRNALDAPYTELRLPLVFLNAPAAFATCGCPTPTTVEAA